MHKMLLYYFAKLSTIIKNTALFLYAHIFPQYCQGYKAYNLFYVYIVASFHRFIDHLPSCSICMPNHFRTSHFSLCTPRSYSLLLHLQAYAHKHTQV